MDGISTFTSQGPEGHNNIFDKIVKDKNVQLFRAGNESASYTIIASLASQLRVHLRVYVIG